MSVYVYEESDESVYRRDPVCVCVCVCVCRREPVSVYVSRRDPVTLCVCARLYVPVHVAERG